MPRQTKATSTTNTDATLEEKPAAKPRVSRKVESDDLGTVATKEEPRPARPTPPSVHREGKPNGIILGPNDPVVLEGDDDGITVTVTRDVYRAIYPYGARRPTYILLYPRGMRVVKSILQPAPKPSS